MYDKVVIIQSWLFNISPYIYNIIMYGLSNEKIRCVISLGVITLYQIYRKLSL